MNDILATDVRTAPYWWDAAPPDDAPPPALAGSYDVVVVGSGCTGLRAAIELLRAGRSVAVIDRDAIGAGASRRNAGYLGPTPRKSLSQLTAAYGLETAVAIYREAGAAFEHVAGFIRQEGIACHLARCGRYVAARSAKERETLARNLALVERHLGYEFRMIPREQQRSEFGSDAYFGGAVIPALMSFHPGLYHRGLVERTRALEGALCGRTEVTSISPSGTGAFRVETTRGSMAAGDVVVATNGYTPKRFSWHARRLMPFTAYMAATEPLPAGLLDDILPHRRTTLDTSFNSDYFRTAPDSERLLFGAATGYRLRTVDDIAQRLHATLRRILPQAADARLGHVWSGQCAGTFDLLPHFGRHEGVWYAMGYNFSGMAMGTYLGWKVAQRLLKRDDRPSVLETPLKSFPGYTGTPWFVPLAMRYYDWRDGRRS